MIIDDLEADFFTPDQLALLERFVSERGGGLLMLGGAESFRHGGYAKTPVGRMLPIDLENVSTRAHPTTYRISLTREGWLQPWARLRSTETEEQQRLKEMPDFLTVSLTGKVKPGATPIAEVTDFAGEKYPAMVVQQFGRGRCAGMMVGDLWRWHMDRSVEQSEKDDLGKTWRQTIRWLIADVPERIEVRTVANDETGQPLMRIEARVRNKDFQPQDNAAVSVNVRFPDGTIAKQLAEPSLLEPGTYISTFALREAGCYRADIEVVDFDGQRLGKAETGWTSDPTSVEFARVLPNFDFLEKLAKRTSGEVVPIKSLDQFVDSLPHRKAPLSESYSTPIWHQPWIFALIILSLCAEWAIRRWKGLP